MSEDLNPTGSDMQAPSNEATPSESLTNTPSSPNGSTVSGQENGSVSSNSDTDNNLPDRTRQKYSHLESENTDLKSRFSRVASFIQQDPELLKKALVETSGMSEQEAVEHVRRVHPNYGASSNQSYNQQPAQNFNQNQYDSNNLPLSPAQQAALNKMAMQEERLDQERRQAITTFRDKYPDLDYFHKQAIVSTAIMYENQGASPSEALERARTQILEPDKLRELGKIEGMSKAYSSMGASASGIGGGISRNTKPSVTEFDEEVMRKLGIDKNPKLREKFMARL